MPAMRINTEILPTSVDTHATVRFEFQPRVAFASSRTNVLIQGSRTQVIEELEILRDFDTPKGIKLEAVKRLDELAS